MKILLFGSNGQVGFELDRTLTTLGNVISFTRADVDFTKPEELRTSIRETAPELIVNAAAYTAVDKAESEPKLCNAINAVAPGIIAEEAKRASALFIHYSTDYVFSGNSQKPYTEVDRPSPLNEYGRSKLQGERNIEQTGARHFIFRTSWVYGARGNNFFRTMLKLASQRPELRVVADQIGAPTCSRSIAEATAHCASVALQDDAIASGIYNMTAAGSTSWFEFASTIFDHALAPDFRPRLVPIKSSEYSTAARRPSYSVLSNEKLARVFGTQLPDWRSQLRLVVEEFRQVSALPG